MKINIKKLLFTIICFTVLPIAESMGEYNVPTSFGKIGGVPTDNSYVSSIPLINKIPYSTDGTLDTWVSGLLKVITLPATTIAQVGSTTASKLYVSSAQVSAIPDTSMDANTKLMLRMDGTNTSQVFVDSSTNNYTVTTYDNTYQSTSIYKFGISSGYFDGSGDALTVADSDDWWINTDYTVRGWIYPTAAAAGTIVFDGNMSPDHLWSLQIVSNDILRFYVQDSGAADFSTTVSDTAVTLNVWNHIAFTRSGNVYRCFVNGSQGEAITETSVRENNAYNLYIGAFNPELSDPFNGYMDNIEIIKGTALYTGTFTVPAANITTGTITQYITTIVAPGTGTNPPVLLKIQTFDTINNSTAQENSNASGTQTVNYFPGSTTVFNSSTQLGTSTLYAGQFNGGVLSNSGFFTVCFDDIKVMIDSDQMSLRSKYLDSFYNMNIKESYARKSNIGWLEATKIAKEKYKQDNFETWKASNINKYYVIENVPGSGTAKSLQIGAMERDYKNYIEESWASGLIQNDYVQKVKDEQEIDKSRKMVRASLSDPSTPAILKATDGSGLSLDNQIGLLILAVQKQHEEIENLKALIK